MWKRLCFVSAGLLLLANTSVNAHEMFLKPKKYNVAPNTEVIVELVNGTFERSDNTIDRDRMIDVSVYGAGERRHASAEDWRDIGKTSVLSGLVGDPGTYAIGVSTKPRLITMTAESFIKYLEHDGVKDTLDEFRASKRTSDVRERYSKHVRTIVQVGDRPSDEFTKVLGYPIEIILERNPSDVAIGDVVPFRVFRNGEPVSGQLVYASYDGFHQHNDEGGHERAETIRTDKEGRGTFTASKAATWYLTLIHMEELKDDPEAEYESNWSTLTFLIK
ncbi:MAG: DUF4198 domain-containing protein [Pseudomonadota bacterium]